MDPKELARKVGRQCKKATKGGPAKIVRDRDDHYYVYEFDVPGKDALGSLRGIFGEPTKVYTHGVANWQVQGAMVVASDGNVEVFVYYDTSRKVKPR